MSKCMVRLQPGQQRSRTFRHPLLNDLPAAEPAAVVSELVDKALGGDVDARDKLITCHLLLLKHTIGRYLHHWPITRRFLDEMVSAGLYGMVKAMDNLTADKVESKSVGIIMIGYIRKYVEEEIAALRGIAPAPVRTNQRRVEHGLEPIFGEVIDGISSPRVQEGYYYIEPGFEEYDVLEAINQLRGEFEQLDMIFDKKYWGMTDKELAKLTGIPRRTVSWYRTELLRRYRNLTGD